jgi:metalloendopeptidase OMA1, mitochondrial
MYYPQQQQQTLGARRSGFSLLRLLPLVFFGLYMAYYYFSHREVVPITGRKQLVDLSREQEAALGYQSYQEILQTEKIVTTGEAPKMV